MGRYLCVKKVSILLMSDQFPFSCSPNGRERQGREGRKGGRRASDRELAAFGIKSSQVMRRKRWTARPTASFDTVDLLFGAEENFEFFFLAITHPGGQGVESKRQWWQCQPESVIGSGEYAVCLCAAW